MAPDRDFADAMQYIGGSRKFGMKLGLERMRAVMKTLGDPQTGMTFIHVAGTNGKGSTSAMIASILHAAGYRTGLFTSPHIEKINERLSIDGLPIGDDDFAFEAAIVKKAATTAGMIELTEFEITAAMAFDWFRREKCDAVVLEVGLGGRFDATNIIESPALAVITSLSLDHTEVLGSTLAQIAGEKAGIIKRGCATVTYPQLPEAEAVLDKAIREAGAVRHAMDPDKIVPAGRNAAGGQIFDYGDLRGLTISLHGAHQLKNAALAAEAALTLAAQGMKITPRHIAAGLEAARWPGRFEILSSDPPVIIDGAHNHQGAQALADALAREFPGRGVVFIFGMLKNRDVADVLGPVLPAAKSIFTVTTRSANARTAEELEAAIKPLFADVQAAASPADALTAALERAGKDDVVCAFGSLYYIGEIRALKIQ